MLIFIVSRKEKLIEWFLSKPKNFTYDDLRKLLSLLGYDEIVHGKTSGSRVAFINAESGHIIRLHKPHPGNELKKYQVNFIFDELKSKGLL